MTGAENDNIVFLSGEDSGNIFETKNKIDSPFYGSKFKTSLSDMVLNIKFINESKKFNNYLNRKLSIDKDGFIKNTPSFDKAYGNIADTKLKNVYNNPEFRKMWHISGDNIKICKDCEFRYNCLLYFENQDKLNPYEFCNYDPIEGKWR